MLSAFREVRKRHSDACPIIVGDQPADAAPESGVTGFLRKEVPDEYHRLQQILGRVPAGASDKERYFSIADH